jgi:hypothetical protein
MGKKRRKNYENLRKTQKGFPFKLKRGLLQ